jgi:stage IV sporulation protein FB
MFGLAETPYDLKFRLLNIPVRVQPFFWLVTAMLGFNVADHDLGRVVSWVACVFVSILVHEYGHGLTARHFGSSASIVLWGFGGLCYNDADRQTRAQRLAVVLMGPGAGFILCGVVMLVTSLIFGLTPAEHWSVVLNTVGLNGDPGDFQMAAEKFRNTRPAAFVYERLVYINLMWGLVNLIPIWPLDGGRVSEIILTWVDRGRGRHWNHVLSLLVAGGLAVVIYMRTEDFFDAAFFGVFAWMNYQELQTIHQSSSRGYSRDEDWWRR